MSSDSQLQDDVIAALKGIPRIHPTSIGVVVRSGVICLTGDVGSDDDKRTAEQAVQQVAGVKALAVALRVISPGHMNGDIEIARCVQIGLTDRNGVRPHSLKVLVENGAVTLSGDVDSIQEKQSALDSLKYLPGINAVMNEIVVRPSVTALAVRQQMELAMQHEASVRLGHIEVSVEGDEVTLDGTVRHWDERQAVVTSARGTRGVRQVIDNLTIAG